MAEYESLEKHKNCMDKTFTKKHTKCNGRGIVKYDGPNGSFYRCRKCLMGLATAGRQITIDGQPFVVR